MEKITNTSFSIMLEAVFKFFSETTVQRSWRKHTLYTKTSRQKDITFCILIFHDKCPLISTNSEIKAALPSQKLSIKGCIQQANTSGRE